MSYLSQQYLILLINSLFLLLLKSVILVQLDRRYLWQLGIAILYILNSPRAVFELNVRRKYLPEHLSLGSL